jgi:hypothetical protein
MYGGLGGLAVGDVETPMTNARDSDAMVAVVI